MKKILFFLLMIALFSCKKDDEVVKYNVIYEVTGSSSGGFDLTYDNNGSTEQISNANSGWTKTLSCDKGTFVYISAQANGTNATVHVKIIVNGSTFKEANSSGSYVIATASGSVE